MKKSIGLKCADAVRDVCAKHVRDVHEEFEGSYGQAKNAVAARRALAELLEGKPLPEPAKDPKRHARLLQALFFMGNASAVRQAVLESKTAKAEIAKDYSDLV